VETPPHPRRPRPAPSWPLVVQLLDHPTRPHTHSKRGYASGWELLQTHRVVNAASTCFLMGRGDGDVESLRGIIQYNVYNMSQLQYVQISQLKCDSRVSTTWTLFINRIKFKHCGISLYVYPMRAINVGDTPPSRSLWLCFADSGLWRCACNTGREVDVEWTVSGTSLWQRSTTVDTPTVDDKISPENCWYFSF